MTSAERDMVETMMMDNGFNTDLVPYTAPPGEEGLDLSYEGGEHEAFDGLSQHIVSLSGCRYVDPRTHHDRIEVQTEHWNTQIDRLVNEYLDYRDCDGGDGMPSIPEDDIIADGSHCLSLADIELVDIFGCSPLYPTTCPHFSIQAQCKTLCHLHNIPYRAYLNMQFSVAYDVYLKILHCVKTRLNAALGRNTPNWRLLNSCLCCVYKLEGEPSLTFEWLATVDGNNSLKRWASTTYGLEPREDSCQPRSDYWIDQATVNTFQNEVRAQTSNHPRQDDWGDVPSEMEGSEFRCTDRWRNAGPEQHKKMFTVFDESGIFIAACRHRFVLLACNMVWSGELAKYPLALLNHLMSVLGENGGCAYDIGCAFAKTLASSSLGPRALALNLRMMTIEEHFSFWDEDKYAALSTFLRNHYQEGLTSIQTLTAELAVLRDALGLTDSDFTRFHSNERAYLDSLKEPPPKELLQIQYVELLRELAKRRAEWQLAREAANQALMTIAAGDLSHILAALTQARIRVDSAYTKLQNAEAFTAHIEIQLQIEERWVVGGEAYNQYKQQASQRQYRAALDELEHLVVMRLFELSKLSLSGTGYKLRQQIGKALQCRSDAIRNALNWYNVQAAALDPPRPQLSWKNITEYSFLGKFDLLHHSRADIRELDWTKPAHREATVKYFKLCRACEEIVRLNVEIC
ncbi:hypothetical protein EDB19DRAFT_1826928 [Suillus lakei]|nr:hypothetical protein EDB19DRAFT_1826928 [Suillus lakei]